MPIFICQRPIGLERVYPSHKSILNRFVRQSTTCPYSFVKDLLVLSVSAPRFKRHRSQQQRKLNVYVDCCSPLAFARASARLAPHAHIHLSKTYRSVKSIYRENMSMSRIIPFIAGSRFYLKIQSN